MRFTVCELYIDGTLNYKLQRFDANFDMSLWLIIVSCYRCDISALQADLLNELSLHMSG